MHNLFHESFLLVLLPFPTSDLLMEDMWSLVFSAWNADSLLESFTTYIMCTPMSQKAAGKAQTRLSAMNKKKTQLRMFFPVCFFPPKAKRFTVLKGFRFKKKGHSEGKSSSLTKSKVILVCYLVKREGPVIQNWMSVYLLNHSDPMQNS